MIVQRQVKHMLKFTKMEGIGNDYIYFDGIKDKVPRDPAFIQKIADRNFGIGSDGMIVLEESDSADFKMAMYNKDGSRGKMCGNGIRCLAKFAYDLGYVNKETLLMETDAGYKRVRLIKADDGTITGAMVDMGVPETQCDLVPVVYDAETMVDAPFMVAGKEYRGTAVSMGNPHVVLYVNDLDFDISDSGYMIEHAPMFPESVNVEFVRVIDNEHIEMRVWERGTGETLACGTGACAAMYASYLNHHVGTTADVKLPGGHLTVTLADNGHILMTGNATTVYTGMLEEHTYD